MKVDRVDRVSWSGVRSKGGWVSGEDGDGGGDGATIASFGGVSSGVLSALDALDVVGNARTNCDACSANAITDSTTRTRFKHGIGRDDTNA